MVVPQSDVGTNAAYKVKGCGSLVLACERGTINRKPLLALLLFAPVAGGLRGLLRPASDLLSKDADWFSRSGRLFIRNVSIETPPLTPEQAGDGRRSRQRRRRLSGNGAAPGRRMPTRWQTALPAAPPPSTTGTVALGHTECDVVRGIGAPDNVNISNNPRGDRVAVVNYSRGQRAGIYTFTAGRLTSIERGPEPVAQPKRRKAEGRSRRRRSRHSDGSR